MDLRRVRTISSRLSFLERFYEAASLEERILIRSLTNSMFDESDRKLAGEEEE